ncbi:ankyrin repeat domain-containing protein 53 [Cladorrhinum samala]|uniref:Ankyrin repeat domain-containing protein 53 n=1 Tax=Cladorrhinum samala TaxID=585594 RepID=A0AAV9HWG8_9PEZI|nr:ankyrin repeat domain-containing protein 53 [Cladorrhinum samala]
MMAPNPFILAADNPQALLELLKEDPSLASGQDEHGYSLVHAAASYNHLDLLRALIRDYKVPVDIKDEDGDTALFVVETVQAAKVLVEEFGLDHTIRDTEGLTAREALVRDGEWPKVIEYLSNLPGEEPNGASTNGTAADSGLPPAPEGLNVTVGQIDEAEVGEQPDPEIRRRIEELAARPDFQTEEGQAALRELVREIVGGEGLAEERNVRARQD